MEGYIGEIRLFGGNFAPRGWAFCDGHLLDIASNSALYSILGATYGGDGRTTFAVPDLRGRVPAHPGQGPGTEQVRQGERFGTPDQVLTVEHLPAHSHNVQCSNEPGNQQTPGGHYNADEGHEGFYLYSDKADAQMGPTTTVGHGASFGISQPSLGLNFIICVNGLYPDRS